MSSPTAKTRERAVALRYRKGEERAPRLVAKGSGHIARRIIEVARANGIPFRVLASVISIIRIVLELAARPLDHGADVTTAHPTAHV